MYKYVGAIILKSGPGTKVPVEVMASGSNQAKAIIEAQYSGQIKQWFTTMSQTNR